jgi:hypothetical protein
MVAKVAIYHCSIKIIGRSSGRSAVGSSAYRAGEMLEDKETGTTHDYTRKSGVVYSEVMLPNHAPSEYQNREILWNEVQKVEKQKNAQLAREIEVGLPREMSREQQIQCVRDYTQNNFVKEGMCADVALHDKGDGNPHAHIMLTTRGIKENGKWDSKERKVLKLDENGERIPVIDKETGLQKIRDRGKKGIEYVWERETVKANSWNDKSKIEEWRKAWAEECNKYLSQEQKIDHRSYARQGIDQVPTIHEGQKARKMEKEGMVSDRCEINRKVDQYNALNKLQKYLENIKIKDKVREINERIERIRNDFGRKFGRDASRDARPVSELARDAGRKRTYEIAAREHEQAERGTQSGERQAQQGKRETERREQQAQSRKSVPAPQVNESVKPKMQEQVKAEQEERTLDRLYQEYKQAYQSYDKAVSEESRCSFFERKKKKECKAETERTRQKLNGIENELAKYGIQREYGVINADERIKRVGEHVQWKKQEIHQQAERNKMNEKRWKHRVDDIDKKLDKTKKEQAERKGMVQKQEKSRQDGFSHER